MDTEVYESAIQFFERASLIQPTEVRWGLMIASCFRRSGNYSEALERYKRIHDKFPDNAECKCFFFVFFLASPFRTTYPFLFFKILLLFLGLRFLVRICTDLGTKDVGDYISKLSKLEQKSKESPSIHLEDEPFGVSYIGKGSRVSSGDRYGDKKEVLEFGKIGKTSQT